jgi:hypothetical protein
MPSHATPRASTTAAARLVAGLDHWKEAAYPAMEREAFRTHWSRGKSSGRPASAAGSDAGRK